MRGWLGNTDYEWYRYLHSCRDLDEVNFWQPSGKAPFKRYPAGTPFFFKLKSPHYAICGFGVFTRFEQLPLWLAWECFGPANGAATFEDFRRSIQGNRGRRAEDLRPTHVIGCNVVSQPVFFDQDQWVPMPSDWHTNVVTGSSYDLSHGEGLRVLNECRERAMQVIVETDAVRGALVRETVEAYGRGVMVKPRLGQGGFRLEVSHAYDHACAVTTEHSLPALEAAHIRKYSEERRHEVQNGLLLRSDIHRLFDSGYVTVTPDYEFKVGDRLREHFKNGKSYYGLAGRKIVLPNDPHAWPDRERLEWHGQKVFVG